MNKEELEPYLKRFPAFSSNKDMLIFYNKEEYDLHNKGIWIKIDEKIKMRNKLIENLLNSDDKFAVLEKMIEEEKVKMIAYYLGNMKILDKSIFTKKYFVALANKAMENGALTLTSKGKERLEYINKQITYEAFLNKYAGKTFNTIIESEEVSMPVDSIIEAMNLPNKDYIKLINNNFIAGINKQKFAYCVKEFFDNNNILKNYTLPSQLKNRVLLLSSYYHIDFESINFIKESQIYKYKDVKLDISLKQYLTENIPENLNDLEKAIYVYIKCCKLFTYDEQFYMDLQKGPSREKHKNINYLSEINLSNKDIVCYEFNAIYGKILDELGIKFKVESTSGNEEYGSGHDKLTFVSGKYIVEADAIFYILRGDLVKAKNNFALTGIKCLNVNEQTVKEFEDSLNRTYKLINSKEKELNALSMYENLSNKQEITFEEKTKIFLQKVKECGKCQQRMDVLGYMVLLNHLIYNEKERKTNFNICALREKTQNKNKVSVVITINKEDFIKNKKDNIYLLYDLKEEIKEVSEEELKKLINEGQLSIFDKERSGIPGLKV